MGEHHVGHVDRLGLGLSGGEVPQAPGQEIGEDRQLLLARVAEVEDLREERIRLDVLAQG